MKATVSIELTLDDGTTIKLVPDDIGKPIRESCSKCFLNNDSINCRSFPCDISKNGKNMFRGHYEKVDPKLASATDPISTGQRLHEAFNSLMGSQEMTALRQYGTLIDALRLCINDRTPANKVFVRCFTETYAFIGYYDNINYSWYTQFGDLVTVPVYGWLPRCENSAPAWATLAQEQTS